MNDPPTAVGGIPWALIELGRSINGAQYLTSVQELQKISRQVAQYFEGIDVLLTPTLGEPPAPLGTFDSPPGEPLASVDVSASVRSPPELAMLISPGGAAAKRGAARPVPPARRPARAG